MHFRRLIPISCICVALASVALVQPAASATRDTPRPRTGQSNPIAVESEVPLYDEVPPSLANLASTAASLIEENEDVLTYSFYDASEDALIVQYSDERGIALVEDRLMPLGKVLLKFVPLSAASIHLAEDTLANVAALTPQIVAVGYESQLNGLRVYTTNAKQGLISLLDTLIRLPFVVNTALAPFEDNESRFLDISPFAGGTRIGFGPSNGGTVQTTCTSAFGQQISGVEYVLTAGHCLPLNTSLTELWTYSSVPLVNHNYVARFHNNMSIAADLSSRKTVSDGQYHGDVAIANATEVNAAVGGSMWLGPDDATSKAPIVGRQAPYVGQNMCYNGAATGSHCGWRVYDTNVT